MTFTRCVRGYPRPFRYRLVLIMKLAIFLTVVFIFQAFAEGKAQKITLNARNTTLRDVMLEIQKQQGYSFLFRGDHIADTRIDARLEQVEFAEAMQKILRGHGLDWSIDDGIITIMAGQTEKHQPPSPVQDHTVTGIVTDESGTPLEGVTVSVVGQNIRTKTGRQGDYRITLPDEDARLAFSSVGFETQEQPTRGLTNLNITLKTAIDDLNEVVVVGYGSVRKSDITGSVASVKGEKITNTSSGSFEALLQGRVAGLHVINSNSDNPQGGSTVRVRGISSINGSNAPLVVVDGIPFGDAGGLNLINPNTILSMEVLKDASATAIYGSRGANGVIMITTKRGDKHVPSVWLDQKTSFGAFSEKLDYWRDPLLMAELADEANENAGIDPIYIGKKDANGTYYPSRADIASGAWPYYTEWADYVFRPTAITSETNLGVQGGGDKSQYYLGLGYYDGEGMQRKDDYKKVTLDLSYQHELSEYLTIISKAGFIDGDRNRNYGMNYQRNPLFPVFNGDGTYFKANALDYGNALAMTNERKDVSPNTDGYATLQFNVKLANPLELVLRGNARAGTAGHNFYNPRVYTQGGDLYDGEGGISSSSYKNVTLDGYLTYTNTFAERHAFTAMGGVTYENGTNKTLNTIGRGFANDNLMEENMSGATERFITNGFSETVLASGFTRFNYAFADKYLFTFTARADGSSKFGDNNKWGFFPSGAASWRLSEEAFLKDVEAIDDLKIRASYGISGNQGIAPYQTISKYGQDYYYLNGEEFIIYGLGQQIGREGIGDRYVQWGGMATKDLRWEKTSQFDLGLDASLFHNRLSITLDYYYKKTSDLLRQQFLNPSTGFDRVWTNDGEIENRGFELAVDGRILTSGKLKFDAGLVFSLNRNKVLNIGSQEKSGYVVDKNGLRYEPYGSGIFSDAYLNVLAIGQPVNAFYGYEVDGIIQEMPDNPVKMTRPGEFNYVGLREDGTLDPDMRRIIGDPNPDFTSSLNLQLRHDAGIDFSLMLYAMYGNDVFSTRKLDRISLQKDRWTGENPNNVRPKLRADRQYFASSWFVEDGSFLRIQHVTLGYTFQRIPFLQQARIFLNATNPIVFSNVSEYDPEVGENGRGSAPYPRVAIYTAGLQLKF